MTAEHVYLEVERLAVLADEPVSDEVRHAIGKKLSRDSGPRQGARGKSREYFCGPPRPRKFVRLAADLQLTIQHLGELSAQILRANDQSTATEIANLLEFIGGLKAIADLLEPRERPRTRRWGQKTEAEDDLGRAPY